MLNYHQIKKAVIADGIPVLNEHDDISHLNLTNPMEGEFGLYNSKHKVIFINEGNHKRYEGKLEEWWSLENSLIHEYGHALQHRFNMIPYYAMMPAKEEDKEMVLSLDQKQIHELIMRREVTAQALSMMILGNSPEGISSLSESVEWFARCAYSYLRRGFFASCYETEDYKATIELFSETKESYQAMTNVMAMKTRELLFPKSKR